jgi:hypothetical protein
LTCPAGLAAIPASPLESARIPLPWGDKTEAVPQSDVLEQLQPLIHGQYRRWRYHPGGCINLVAIPKFQRYRRSGCIRRLITG